MAVAAARVAVAIVLLAGGAFARTPDDVMRAMGLPGGRGGESGRVERMQTDLAWIGLLTGPIDGRMGEITRRAAARFQTSLGARPTGRLTIDEVRALRQRAASVERAAEFRRENHEWNGMRLDIPHGFFDEPRAIGKYAEDLLFVGRDVARTRLILRRYFQRKGAETWRRELATLLENNKHRVVASGTSGDMAYIVAVDPNDPDDPRDDRRAYYVYHVGGREMRGAEISMLDSEEGYMRPFLARILRDFDPVAGPGLSIAEMERRMSVGDVPGGAGRPDWYRTMIGNGSGSIVSRLGHVLTNHHVISGCPRLSVNGRTATLLGSDVRLDLALLLVPALEGREPVRFAADPPDLGEDVLVLGYPVFSMSPSLNATTGVISSSVGLRGDRTRFQVTAPIQPGNSGGPVISVGGAQVAVVASKASTAVQVRSNVENIGWVIRGAEAVRFLRRFDVEPIMRENAYSLPDTGLAESLRTWRRFAVRVECRSG